MKFDLIALLGLMLIAVGVGLVSIPGALVVAGIGLILYALLGGYAAILEEMRKKEGR